MSQARPVDGAGVPIDSDRAQASSGTGDAPTPRTSSSLRMSFTSDEPSASSWQ
jgi:hypothetical protein